MNNIIISDELLVLFLEGKTTAEESAAVLEAAIEDSVIREVLLSTIEGMLLEEASGVSANQSARSVCESYQLHSRHLPALRLAANSQANDCVVKCEHFVLNRFGEGEKYDNLIEKARQKKWLQDNGTPLHNIGRLLELAGLSVSRRFNGSLAIIKSELMGGCSIIVAIDTMSLTNSNGKSEINHAVVVNYIDEDEDYVEFYDPQSDNPIDRYSIEDFLRAWEPAKNYFVSIIERGVRPYTPHPEYVDDIELPTDIMHIADILAENAHDIWAKDRLAEAEKKKAKGKDVDPYDDPYMKPFMELPSEKKTTDYLSSLNTIKLLYKLGFEIIKGDKTTSLEYKPNVPTADGQYIPQPIDVDDVTLPKEIADLTEYIAENAHEEWAKQRIKEGYKYAPKTNKKRLENADLIPYCELLDSEKEYDRKMAMNTLRVLYKLGYEIIKQ